MCPFQACHGAVVNLKGQLTGYLTQERSKMLRVTRHPRLFVIVCLLAWFFCVYTKPRSRMHVLVRGVASAPQDDAVFESAILQSRFRPIN